ncbi:MAG TPA: hypothetical protein VH969_16920 [Actinophytocola sp.]|jgi:hypothetical protein|uniref:hypothetical protein n=1 Tax=Actinophytocola sp. TaxID=1872138 RepID=UPI002F936819
MPHEDDLRDDELETGTGVGTDGSLRSPEEPLDEHGADRSGELSDGVGTDGSLVNPDKEVLEEVEEGADVTDPEYSDRREPGMNRD